MRQVLPRHQMPWLDLESLDVVLLGSIGLRPRGVAPTQSRVGPFISRRDLERRQVGLLRPGVITQPLIEMALCDVSFRILCMRSHRADQQLLCFDRITGQEYDLRQLQ